MDYEHSVLPLARALLALGLSLRLTCMPHPCKPTQLLSHKLSPMLSTAKRSVQIYTQSGRFFPLLRQIRALSYGGFVKSADTEASHHSQSPLRNSIGHLRRSTASPNPLTLRSEGALSPWVERKAELYTLSTREEKQKTRERKISRKNEVQFKKRQEILQKQIMENEKINRETEWTSFLESKRELKRISDEKFLDDLNRSREKANLSAFSKAKAAEVRKNDSKMRAEERKAFFQALKTTKK